MLRSLLVLALSAALVSGQLAGPVGPTTTYQQKAAVKVCNVLTYGAKPNGKTDFGPALYSAWQACKKGGLVYIPPGSYGLESRINLRGGTNVALQLDGTIIRRGTAGGTLLTMRGIKDFEFFSGNSKGAIQGFGFEFLKDGKYGPRFMRLQDIDGFSMHGLALVDSPSYYVVLDNVRNGEIYNMILRGITVGMTDAFDVSAVNTWIHDIEITNGDECVTIKQGSHNVLIETVYCNISGGNAVGSLGTGTNITDVVYRNIYLNRATGAYIKTNGGSGIVRNMLWENIIMHDSANMLTINAAWMANRGAEGVQLQDLTFRNWRGYNRDAKRPVIQLECDKDVPCTDITLENVDLWTTDGDEVGWTCQNAFGKGACLREGPVSAYEFSKTVVSVPAARHSATRMANDHSSPFPSTAAFTVPPIPTTFFPGMKPTSALLDITGPGGLDGSPSATSTSSLSGSTSSSPTPTLTESLPTETSSQETTSPSVSETELETSATETSTSTSHSLPASTSSTATKTPTTTTPPATTPHVSTSAIRSHTRGSGHGHGHGGYWNGGNGFRGHHHGKNRQGIQPVR